MLKSSITNPFMLFVLCSIFAVSSTSYANEILYDTDTEQLLVDTDADGYPDLTEQLGNTDAADAKSYPGAETALSAESLSNGGSLDATTSNASGFPATSCRAGYILAGPRLCISQFVQNATRFDAAIQRCRDQRGRVATYGDLFYLYIRTGLDASYNPRDRWVGNWAGDDKAFYGNRDITFNNDPDIWNFEGVANKANSRAYWCAHDRL